MAGSEILKKKSIMASLSIGSMNGVLRLLGTEVCYILELL